MQVVYPHKNFKVVINRLLEVNLAVKVKGSQKQIALGRKQSSNFFRIYRAKLVIGRSPVFFPR